jgi:MoaA/NifB/PqqE/SkfB family radical SAM enzyme
LIPRAYFGGRRSFGELQLESLSVILTDQCNFDCSYCYQDRGDRRLDVRDFARTVDLFHPVFAPQCTVSFYGGEPLLAFDLMERAVEHLKGRPARAGHTIRFSLTTNGSLLNEEILAFLADHEFSVVLSFDGLAQGVTRKKDTFGPLKDVIASILGRPGISLETNSVFSAETVGYLAGSIEGLVRLGVPKLDVNFAHTSPWTPSALRRLEDEISRVGDLFLARYDRLSDVPWADFRQEPARSVRHCPAGEGSLALSAGGELWGCAIFPHYRGGGSGSSGCADYGFGDVRSFARDPQRIYEEKMGLYAGLRMDRFSTPAGSCLMCRDVEQCWICPLAAGLVSGEIGRIPAASCERARIMRKGIRSFLEAFDRRGRPDPGESPG